jgi:hypothetical protein
LFFISEAFADYKPPAKASAPSGQTTATGVRGVCSDSAAGKLTALAPHSYVGQTVSIRPTFAWFVPDSDAHALEFRLYHLNSDINSQPFYKAKMQSRSGIMQYTLPQKQAGLSVGQRYSWQVVLICDPNRPSTAQIAEAEIEVVVTPSTLKQELATAKNRLEKASQYAEAGIWYDALKETLLAPTNSVTLEARLKLLTSLAESEVSNALGAQSDQGYRLKQIIAIEKQGNL